MCCCDSGINNFCGGSCCAAVVGGGSGGGGGDNNCDNLLFTFCKHLSNTIVIVAASNVNDEFGKGNIICD